MRTSAEYSGLKGLPHQEALAHLNQQKIGQGCYREESKINRRQWNKTEFGCHRRIWEQNCYHHNGQSGGGKCPARPAAQRISGSTYDEQHQGLRGQRLDKPSGMKFLLAGMQPMEKNVKSEEVIEGADWPNENHEVANEFYVPSLGCAYVGIVHVVGG